MLATLKSLISVHQKANATTAEIEAALAGARDEMAAAMRVRDSAAAAYRDGLLSLDVATLHQLTADQSAAIIRGDRATALVEALTGQLAAAQAAEDQMQRRERYDAAAKARSTAAKVLATEYPKHARALAGLLRTVAEADALVEGANEALPAGVERLTSTEGEVRRYPGTPGRVLKEESFTRWCRPDGSELFHTDQPKVEVNADGVSGTHRSDHHPPITVHLRRFSKVTRIPEGYPTNIASLAATLNLPGLNARHVPFWRYGAAELPAGIVARLDEDAPLWGKLVGPVDAEPAAVTEILPLDEPADRAA